MRLIWQIGEKLFWFWQRHAKFIRLWNFVFDVVGFKEMRIFKQLSKVLKVFLAISLTNDLNENWFACMDMIRMPHVCSNISIIAELGIYL
jgi:hypothetical protein